MSKVFVLERAPDIMLSFIGGILILLKLFLLVRHVKPIDHSGEALSSVTRLGFLTSSPHGQNMTLKFSPLRGDFGTFLNILKKKIVNKVLT